MKSGKKIFRIYSRLNIGGPSYHVVNLCHGMEQYGYASQLLVGRSPEWEGDLSDYAHQQTVDTLVVDEFGPKISIVRDTQAFLKMAILMLHKRPEIVHTHTFKAGLLGRLAAILTFRPIIVHTYHGHLFSGYWGKIKTYFLCLIERILNHFTHSVVVVSEKIKEDLIRYHICPEDKIKVIELGFNMSYIDQELNAQSNLRRQLGIAKTDVIIGSVGRMVPIKNFSLFLHSLIPLARMNSQVHLVLIGEGPCRRELEILADQLCHTDKEFDSQLRNRIHFMNWLIPFQRQLKDFDIYVCCSKNEGTSVAVIESLIGGIPVVSTNVGGMPDLLKNGLWGKLVSQGEEELRNACQELVFDKMDNCRLDRLKAISLQARSRFDQERLFFEVDRLYKDLSC